MPGLVGEFYFDASGQRLAWSNADGTVNVADLEPVRRDDEMER